MKVARLENDTSDENGKMGPIVGDADDTIRT